MLKLNNQRGDTIVEVMIALAILGLAFGIAFSTANQSLQNARNSQEHSEALQYLASQVELLRKDSTDSRLYSTANSPFCMDPANGAFTFPLGPHCTVGPVGYALKISYSPAHSVTSGQDQDVFTLTATWPGLGSLGTQTETIQYKLHHV